MNGPAPTEGAVAVSEQRRSSPRAGRGGRPVRALDQRLPVSAAGKGFPRESFPGHWPFPLEP
ncbi:hypothetical protein ACF09H_16245 [Streptomyces sp. NPDC014983]|uniref:hypothetical protein n=1 Tax=Streptomyces sp. NPDC014983 TaxID=3364933 RepID=UPI003701BE95